MRYEFRFFVITSCLIAHFGFDFSLAQSIPMPQKTRLEKGVCDTRQNFEVLTNSRNLDFEKQYLLKHLELFKHHSGRLFTTNPGVSIQLSISTQRFSSEEAYTLKISPNQVEITAGHAKGIFRGITTFIQIYAEHAKSDHSIPAARISDQPKFKWRGMHLDVSRHFYDVDFIKKYLDLLAFYKMNIFHWHLTDDQGWRIEIKKYAKLTEIGAWRNGTMVGPYSDQKFNNKLYGGFYTQEQIKEVVNYAAQRHITVVPEIEMPGHAMAALASYPQFSCNGGPFEVAQAWGVYDDVFCAKEETFAFLEDILTEVVALFPSEIIHIGGDECPKTRWKTCAKCQKTMKDNHIKDEHELQSYFIQRMEKFLNSKGRELIGWDEILEGGLAPGALVMSWRGTEGGIAAAKQKHCAVMTPGSHCYFDHYQGDMRHEPLAFGGYTTLEKVYSFNPIPKELSKKQARYILGAQANVWTEYICGTFQDNTENRLQDLNIWKEYMTPQQHVEYMVLPRLLALSEVTWGTSQPDKYEQFLKRVLAHQKNILSTLKYNFSRSIYEIKLNVFAKNGQLFAELSSPLIKQIFYGLESKISDVVSGGTSNNLVQGPILISKTCDLEYFHQFDATNSMEPQKMSYNQSFHINKATAKEIELVKQPHKNYNFGGAFSLVNGIHARGADLSKDWLGFSGDDLIATIHLGRETPIKMLGINVMAREGSWVYFPKSVLFEISDDGVKFREVAKVLAEEIKSDKGKVRVNVTKPIEAKYIRVHVTNFGLIPEGNPGAGNKAWLFADEIVVD